MTFRTPENLPVSGGRAIPLGVWLLGRGRAQGIGCFGNSPQAVFSALAPTIALSVIGLVAGFLLPHAQITTGMTRALVPLICTLLQLVVSEFYARYLNRSGLWMRFAAASLWCGWLPLILMIVVQGLFHAFAPALEGSAGSVAGMALGIQCYSLWLAWYIARVGLETTRWQAFVMTVFQTLATAILLAVLWVLPPHYNALVDMLGGAF